MAGSVTLYKEDADKVYAALMHAAEHLMYIDLQMHMLKAKDMGQLPLSREVSEARSIFAQRMRD